MPNLPQQQTIVQYVTNVSQLQYTFAFYAPLPTDIQVYYQASNAPAIPASDLLVLNVNYTVTYNVDPTTGGYITLLVAPTTGYYLTINRQVGASLNTNFANAQNFSGANLDAALDRLLLLCQQNQNYNLQRNLSYVINTYLPNASPYTQLPTLAQNQVWVGSGSGITAAVLATSPSASVLQSLLASMIPEADGASIVGYYDTVDSVATTVAAFLNNLPAYISNFLTSTALGFKTGMMIDYGSTTPPAGWLVCDGSAVSRTTYANLFATISTIWGVGDGSTTFNLPNLKGSVSVGSGGLTTTQFSGNTVGYMGGEYKHTLLETELAAHNHPGSIIDVTTTGLGGSGQSVTLVHGGSTATLTITSDGNNTPFNVMQPGAVVLKIIKT
jgi:microcystin-dependent protein